MKHVYIYTNFYIYDMYKRMTDNLWLFRGVTGTQVLENKQCEPFTSRKTMGSVCCQ